MKTSKPTAEEIAALKSKVEPLLQDWISSKTRRRSPYSLMPSKLAKLINLPTKELEMYFDYCIPIGFYGWLAKTKVTIAENVMRAHPNWDDKTIADFVGYDNKDEFVNAFEYTYRLSPARWRFINLPAAKSRFYYEGELFHRLPPLLSAWEESKDYCLSSASKKQLAQYLEITVYELELYFQRCLNTTFEKRIDKLRIQEAKKLILENPNLKTTDLAHMVGYGDSFFFSQVFYNLTGKLPEEWRKTNIPGYHNPKREQVFDDEGVEEWIQKKRYCRPNLPLKIVAQECGFSDFRFIQYLREVKNKSFDEWISELRFDEAKRILINNPSLSTEKVGISIGISKTGFIAWFKERVGYTPEEWRGKVFAGKETGAESPEHIPFLSPSARNKVEKWIKDKGFCEQRLSLSYVAKKIGISADQLSSYYYKEGFRQFPVWISKLRIEESLKLLVDYPSMQIVEISTRVGMTDVKIFRAIFKKVTGTLPIAWRKQHIDSGESSTIPSVTPIDFTIDIEKLKEIQRETSESHMILSDIFKEDDDVHEVKIAKPDKDTAVTDILRRLLEKDSWSRKEFDSLCERSSLLPGYVLEQINDIAYETVGDLLIEEEKDSISVALEYKESFIH